MISLLVLVTADSHAESLRPAVQNSAYATEPGGKPAQLTSLTSYMAAPGRRMRLGLSPLGVPHWFERDPACASGNANCSYSGFAVEYWMLLASQVGGVGSTYADWESLAHAPVHTYWWSCLLARTCDAVLYDHSHPQQYQWDAPYYSDPGRLADPTLHRSEQLAYVAEYNNKTLKDSTAPDLPTQGLAVMSPHYTDFMTGVVLQTRERTSVLASVFQPFSTSLWVATLVFVLISAGIMFVIMKLLALPEAKPAGAKGGLGAVAYALHLQEERKRDKFSKAPNSMMKIGVLVVVHVLKAFFIASLTSILTRPTFKVHGPTSMSELKEATACFKTVFQAHQFSPFVGRVLFPTNADGTPVVLGVPEDATDGRVFTWEETERYCQERLLDGSADIWIDLKSFATPAALRNCPSASTNTSFVIQPAIQFAPQTFSFVLREKDADLANHLSAANIFYSSEHPAERLQLEERWFSAGKACPPVGVSEETGIDYESVSGVFVVFGAFAVLALVLAAARRWSLREKQVGGEKGDVELTAEPTHAGAPHALLDRLDAIQSEVQEAMTETRDLISQNELRARTTLVITARRAERHEQEEGTGHAPQS